MRIRILMSSISICKFITCQQHRSELLFIVTSRMVSSDGWSLAIIMEMVVFAWGENALPYFNPNDLYHADCVPDSYRASYVYYGNKSVTRDNIPCAAWANVPTPHSSVPQWRFPEENAAHSACRSLDYKMKDARGLRHGANKQSYKGPWCYNSNGGRYTPGACFNPCPKNYRTTLGSKKKRVTTDGSNYHSAVLDEVATRVFSEYDWGPESYYTDKPSTLTQSRRFIATQEKIFYIMLIIMAVFVAGIIALHVKKEVFKMLNSIKCFLFGKRKDTEKKHAGGSEANGKNTTTVAKNSSNEQQTSKMELSSTDSKMPKQSAESSSGALDDKNTPESSDAVVSKTGSRSIHNSKNRKSNKTAKGEEASASDANVSKAQNSSKGSAAERVKKLVASKVNLVSSQSRLSKTEKPTQTSSKTVSSQNKNDEQDEDENEAGKDEGTAV